LRKPSEEILARCQGLHRPEFSDVLRARKAIAPHLPRTPLHRYAALDQKAGFALYVKHENHQPIGAFKIRGGLNLVLSLTPEERSRGVVTASSGNHGQSLAFASRMTGGKAKVVVLEGASPIKIAAIRAMGAEVVQTGHTADAIVSKAMEIAQNEQMRFVHPGNEPLLIAGVATETLEILEDAPDIDTLFVPLGGGSGASGACLVAKAINPRIRVIAVQAEGAPAFYRSWKENAWITTDSTRTFADGLATSSPFAFPLSLLIEQLDDIVLLSEDELRGACRMAIEETRNLAEGAGAAALGAAWKLRIELAGHKVAVIMSGGNLAIDKVRWVLGVEG
jgi:threonine dehydratase